MVSAPTRHSPAPPFTGVRMDSAAYVLSLMRHQGAAVHKRYAQEVQSRMNNDGKGQGKGE
jgi:hypothetical protein